MNWQEVDGQACFHWLLRGGRRRCSCDGATPISAGAWDHPVRAVATNGTRAILLTPWMFFDHSAKELSAYCDKRGLTWWQEPAHEGFLLVVTVRADVER